MTAPEKRTPAGGPGLRKAQRIVDGLRSRFYALSPLAQDATASGLLMLAACLPLVARWLP